MSLLINLIGHCGRKDEVRCEAVKPRVFQTVVHIKQTQFIFSERETGSTDLMILV